MPFDITLIWMLQENDGKQHDDGDRAARGDIIILNTHEQ